VPDDAKPKRPFWMHQLAEYVLGAVLVAQGLQSITPAMPSVAGGLIMANAAIVRGPLAAFRGISRPVHRVLDGVVVLAVIALAVQPWVSVEATTRLTMAVIAGIMGFIAWQTNYTEKVRSARSPITPADGRGAEIGRMAGRFVGDGVNVAKRLRKK
jgi:O-antigen ligase